MKTKNLLYIGLALLGLSSCNDYLDVDTPSKFTDDYVMSNTEEANRLLNGVYQKICQDATYGSNYFTTFCLNSDVEFFTSTAEEKSASHNEWRLFDGEADGSNLLSLWNAAYSTIETANNFINVAEASKMYADKNEDLLQMIGEAKCLRAMQYLDLVIMFGDVPFSLTRTYDRDDLVMPLAEGGRDEILTTLINDLRAIAPKMKFASDLTGAGVERCSKEFAWSLIAKIALYRGGYSLRPGASETDKGTMQRASDYQDYYQITRTYCDSVIQSNTHALTKDWYQVFIDECNFKVAEGDDPIFEIPFSQDVSGRVGNVHGPAVTASNAGGTDIAWGVSAGTVRLNAFHRFTYNENDVRRNAIGYWSYDYAGTPTILGATAFNNYTNKWSKLWDESAATGPQSSTNTGINFPYMRYADVLLMFAEAENELNGPTQPARNALKQVRERAFRGAANANEMVNTYVDAANSKEDFFNLIVDERAWEFAGESSRWKDLVRWNLYTEKIYLAFWKYYGFGSDDYSYDLNDEYDLINKRIFFKVIANDGSYPNKTLDILTFYTEHNEDDGKDYNTLWTPLPRHWLYDEKTGEWYESVIEPSTTGSDAWKTVDGDWYKWIDDNTGIARAECRCSLRGYIYVNEQGRLISEAPEYSDAVNLKTLPSVRYILPIPKDAINRSNGLYKNYYGY